MKTGKYYLGLAIVIGIFSTVVFGEVRPASPSPQGELPPTENEPLLLAQPNPALTGVRQLYIVILTPDTEPNKDGLVLKDLEAAVESKISQGGFKIARAIQHEHTLRSLDIPELRIYIDMLKVEEPAQYIFHIETTLAKKAYLTKDASRRVKVELWRAEPVMQAAPAEGMPAAVTGTVLEQVEAFIYAHQAANHLNKRISGSDANDISGIAEEQAGLVPSSQQGEPNEYKYVASKNGNVFHRLDCKWVKKIKPENLVYYSSRDEAINAGKKPCKQCNP
jgi:methylphosphotriester-DNA--protein-cysteine methyltransferase